MPPFPLFISSMRCPQLRQNSCSLDVSHFSRFLGFGRSLQWRQCGSALGHFSGGFVAAGGEVVTFVAREVLTSRRGARFFCTRVAFFLGGCGARFLRFVPPRCLPCGIRNVFFLVFDFFISLTLPRGRVSVGFWGGGGVPPPSAPRASEVVFASSARGAWYRVGCRGLLLW